MENKILGIDLGTNSIGLAVRNPQLGDNVTDQLEYFCSDIFTSGVGKGQSGEYSLAAERTKYRAPRRLRQARKYRIWRTLQVLIDAGMCPLRQEELDAWTHYDKVNKRHYPLESEIFAAWIKLDFNGDGKPDYTSPYALRAELMGTQFDWQLEASKMKLGRAMLHIAQRRGFKSSKGETMASQEETSEKDFEDVADQMQKSEEKKSKGLCEYMQRYNCPTVGCAFYHMEQHGIRVRGNDAYQAVRSQYEEEIRKIFAFQEGLSTESTIYRQLLSHKKGEGSIFYKRPLRSQKGLVGKCILEPSKSRCPQSRPEFEIFRAWSLINNIRYSTANEKDRELSLVQKESIFFNHFVKARKTFPMSNIREWLQKGVGSALTLNYSDKTTISGCPVCYRLKQILGDNWMTAELQGYNYEELWHVCFEADEAEYVQAFCENHLHADAETTKKMTQLWGSIGDGYAMLSLKAINNINYFLRQGLIYSDAAVMAKLPDVFKENWAELEDTLVGMLPQWKEETKHQQLVCRTVNNLIAEYKSHSDEEQFAVHDTTYRLDNSDWQDCQTYAKEVLSQATWKQMEEESRNAFVAEVGEAYQSFFNSAERTYLRVPKLTDTIAAFVCEHFEQYIRNERAVKNLYHPSAINVYKPAKLVEYTEGNSILSKRFLESPEVDAYRNPMAMRTLHILRRHLNELLKKDIIDESTRVVVETTRSLNDANMRWAIEEFQHTREEENAEFAKLIEEFFPTRAYSKDDVEKVRLLMEQSEEENMPALEISDQKLNSQKAIYKKNIDKYRAWVEQGFRDIYTGKMIPLSQLFDSNAYDFEHTMPRSLSFDDSLANRTICDAEFNRKVKKNQLPSSLPMYEEILTRIQPWIEKEAKTRKMIDFWRNEAKKASTPERHDQCMRQRHLWMMEHDYWQKKVARFTMKADDLTVGFRNSQLVDTGVITRYAYLYLKTVFSRVDVQKGETTAAFRKILGLQSVEEKKNRSMHSHHAVDATVLTLIPESTTRQRMLENFYQKEEAENLHDEKTASEHSKALNLDLKRCHLGKQSNIVPYIEEKIIVRHIHRDQTLADTRKRVRVRGKVQHTADGKEMWKAGDNIRGQLHKASWLGAIKQGDDINYVKRVQLKYKANAKDSGFKDWDDLRANIVEKHLVDIFMSQFPAGTTFKDACAEGIWMLNKNGERINKVRHVRIVVRSKNPLIVKEHTFPSKQDHKRSYYAENGDCANVYYALYWDGVIGHPRGFACKNLMEIARMKKYGGEIFEPNKLVGRGKQVAQVPLHAVLQAGTAVLVYTKDEVNVPEANNDFVKQMMSELEPNMLNKRLYIMTNVDDPKDGRLQFKYHLEARNDNQLLADYSQYGKLGAKGFSSINIEEPWPKLRLSLGNFDFLIEGKDFRITTTGIEFL